MLISVRTLVEGRGDRPIRGVLAALRRLACQGRPDPVYLVAGYHRTSDQGPPPDWSLGLVPPPGALP